MRARSGIVRRSLVAWLLLGVSACATPQTAHQEGPPPAPSPSDGEQPQVEALKASLQALMTSRAAGRAGTLKGVGILEAPPAPPVLLVKGTISLIPSTPNLEATLREIGRRWREGRRHPVSEAEFQGAFGVLDRHVLATKLLSGQDFIRKAETDDKGRFAFENVPEGRWLLITTVESPVSALLWAVPGMVIAGKTTFVKVENGNIFIEGLKLESEDKATR